MRFYCNGCNSVISEEDVKIHREPSEAWGHIVYEEYYVCPYCENPAREYYGKDSDIYGEDE